MNRHSQKGSALLIVLGFLSFMVVSAVAFAIWMRTERLPSSALRRTVMNRYLVKAALAQAMSRVDDAIRSHAYPGAWNTNAQDTVYRDQNNCAYDWWESRVFMPPDQEGKTKANDPYSRYAPSSKTVSVLNLEALGYLPPSIVNDVRLLSRSSWAAKWDYFNFDAGRYAFCAVNVSDMLDINKIAVAAPRTSASASRAQNSGEAPPASRFSLAYLLRSGESNFSSEPAGMDSFEERIHKSLPGWKSAPLVSLMDYNLVLGRERFGMLWSPFYYLVSGNNKSGNFYNGNGETMYAKGARRQPFITDTWFPASDSEKDLGVYDIARYQPFDNTERASLKDVERKMRVDNQFWVKLYREGYVFSRLDPMMLSDYLDVDNVPLSLAMPCVERVPMITTLGPAEKSLTVTFTSDDKPSKTETADNEKREYYDVKIKVTPPRLSSGLIFPFKGGSGDDSRKFTVETVMRLVFVDEGKDPKPDTPLVNRLRISKEFTDSFRPKDESEWKANDDKQFMLPSDSEQSCLLLNLFGSLEVKADVTEGVQDVRDIVDGDNMHQLGTPEPREATILQKVKITKQVPDGSGGLKDSSQPPTYRYQIVLKPFDQKGAVVDINTELMEEADFNTLCADHNIRPYLLTWTRVKDGEGKTVDMVPATYQDDALNGISNEDAPPVVSEVLGNDNDDNLPILHFPSKMILKYTDASASTPPAENEWLYKSCYAVDPRYNWAPENWWFSEEDSPTVKKWYEAVFKEGGILDMLVKNEFGVITGNPRGDRARDPFLFVSNNGYLQSIGELAFLPHVSEIDNTTESGFALHTAYNGDLRIAKGDNYDDLKTMPCARAAWRSYQTYRTNPNAFEFGANLYRRGLVNAPQGFYVNPFTQEREVMLAAVAQTPLNYWVTGTNNTGAVQGKDKKEKLKIADTFDANTQYHADIVAEYMMHRFDDLSRMIKFTSNPSGKNQSYMIQKVWEDLFDALDWAGRLKEGTTVKDVYEELNDYLQGGGGVSNYKDMYTKENGYGALNSVVTGSNRPVIELDVSRAVHADEYADPLYYFRGRQQPDNKNPRANSYVCDVDRMFLHSYWRDCFANKQQLFLIFVRAEATALGGAGEGTPAQQGGRAVALVWRDPGAPSGSDVWESESSGFTENDVKRHPHKMRVLFYRQFD